MPRAGAVLIILAVTLLGGCSGLLVGPKEPPVTTYLLAPDLAEESARGRGPTVLVSSPVAAAGYATARMPYIERDYRVDYFAYHEWVDTPAEMLRPLLAAALRASGRFRAVTEDGRGIDADVRVQTYIIQMHQDFRVRPSRGSVVLRVQLVDLDGRRVLGTRIFTGEAPAPTEDAYGGVVAVNRVLTRLLAEIADFAVDAAGHPGLETGR